MGASSIASFGKSADRKQVFWAVGTPGFRAELNDRCRCCRTHPRKFPGPFAPPRWISISWVGGWVGGWVGFSPAASGANHADAVPGFRRSQSTPPANQSSLFPCASYAVIGPNSAPCSAICARSPTITICAFAESKCRRAAARTSAAVNARIRSRYVSR